MILLPTYFLGMAIHVRLFSGKTLVPKRKPFLEINWLWFGLSPGVRFGAIFLLLYCWVKEVVQQCKKDSSVLTPTRPSPGSFAGARMTAYQEMCFPAFVFIYWHILPASITGEDKNIRRLHRVVLCESGSYFGPRWIAEIAVSYEEIFLSFAVELAPL